MTYTLTTINKILIVQQRPYGDVLLATSYLEALQSKFPQAAIDFFVSEPYDQVVDGHPFIRSVITSPAKKRLLPYLFGRGRAIVKIALSRYDLVIDQQGNPGSAIIVLLSMARFRLGWASTRGGKYFCNIKAVPGPSRYHGNRNFDMLAPIGISEQPYRLYHTIRSDSRDYIDRWLSSNAIAPGRFICICTQSLIKVNRWDDNSYLRLITIIGDRLQLPVILTYAPSEKAAVQSIVDRSGNRALLSPPTSYNQVAALLSLSKILITLDGGLNHLSVATQTPTIALFGKISASCWSPQGCFPHHYHLLKPHAPDDTTLGISPEEVFSKMQQLLDELP